MKELPLRTLTIALALASVACSTSPESAPDSIAGTWSSQSSISNDSIPASFSLTEDSSSISVTGLARWTGDTVQVGGSYSRPQISLLWLSNSDLHSVVPHYYSGKALDANTIVLNGTRYLRQP